MFAAHANKTKISAERKSERANPSLDRKARPESNPVWQSLALRSVGVQPKLTISQPDDPYEREADRVADRVMRMAIPPSSHDKLSFTSIPFRKAQRKCDECEEEEKKLQRKEQDGHEQFPETASSLVHEALNSLGQSLDPLTRSFMEPRFGHDFSNVRVHADARAAESTRAISAK